MSTGRKPYAAPKVKTFRLHPATHLAAPEKEPTK